MRRLPSESSPAPACEARRTHHCLKSAYSAAPLNRSTCGCWARSRPCMPVSPRRTGPRQPDAAVQRLEVARRSLERPRGGDGADPRGTGKPCLAPASLLPVDNSEPICLAAISVPHDRPPTRSRSTPACSRGGPCARHPDCDRRGRPRSCSQSPNRRQPRRLQLRYCQVITESVGGLPCESSGGC